MGEPAADIFAAWMLGTCRRLCSKQVQTQVDLQDGTICAHTLVPLKISFFFYNHRFLALAALARSFWLSGQSDRAIVVAHRVLAEGYECLSQCGLLRPRDLRPSGSLQRRCIPKPVKQ